jgi:hypothetical protein
MLTPKKHRVARSTAASVVRLVGHGAAAVEQHRAWKAGLHCDVHIQGDDGGPPLACNKAVLSACSPALSRMCNGTGDIPGAATLRVGVPSEVLFELVDAAYSHELQLSAHAVMELYTYADYLNMQSVCDACMFFVKTDDAFQSASASMTHMASALELGLSHTGMFYPVVNNVLANFYRLDQDALLEFVEQLPALAERLLSSSHTKALCERQVLDFALKVHDLFPELNALKHVRYCFVDAVQLTRLPADFELTVGLTRRQPSRTYFYAPVCALEPGNQVVVHPSAYFFTTRCLELLCAPPFSLSRKEACVEAERAFAYANTRVVVLKTHPATATTPATVKVGLPPNMTPPKLCWLPQDTVLAVTSREFVVSEDV